jgi:hypothetical protein
MFTKAELEEIVKMCEMFNGHPDVLARAQGLLRRLDFVGTVPADFLNRCGPGCDEFGFLDLLTPVEPS